MNMTIKEIRTENLVLLLKQSQLTQAEFAKKVGTSAAYISQILSSKIRRYMGDMVARNIEMAFGLYKGWMDQRHDTALIDFGRSINPEIPANAEFIGDLETWDDGAPLAQGEIVLPRFPDSTQLAGIGLPNMRKLPIPILRFSKASLKQLGIEEKNIKCLNISGNSMAPVLPEGTILGVDISKTAITDGDLYAIDHAGSLRVKMIYKMVSGGIRLRSYNIQEWPDELIGLDEIKKVKIVGRVFWWTVLR